MRKISTFALVAIILLICGAMVAAGFVYQLKLQGNLTVRENTNSGTKYQVVAYSDPSCTNRITYIDFPDVVAGNDAATTIYLKNTGAGTFTSFEANFTLTDSGGEIRVSGSERIRIPLGPGESTPFTITVLRGMGEVGFATGEYDVSITIDCFSE